MGDIKKLISMATDPQLKELYEAIIAEVDMDACSPRLGNAVNAAQRELERQHEAHVRAQDRFSDQSKW